MKGNPKVLVKLNEALREELLAINQYFLHAEMCENWGYKRLSDYIKKQSIGEMKHAEALIERILFLDGVPSMTEPMQLTVGKNVKEQIESDLKLEVMAVKMYNEAIKLSVEEAHVDWLEAQVHMIGEIGYERYLSRQMEEEE